MLCIFENSKKHENLHQLAKSNCPASEMLIDLRAFLSSAEQMDCNCDQNCNADHWSQNAVTLVVIDYSITKKQVT